MNHFHAEKIYYQRTPVLWLVLSLLSLLFAWGYLLLIELFQSNQVQFAGMSDAPTVLDAVIFQAIQWQVKLLILFISIIGGLSYSRWAHTGFNSFFLQSQHSVFTWIRSKFLAALTLIIIFSLPLWIQVLWMTIESDVNAFRLTISVVGWCLLVFWMLSLTQCISSFCNNSAFSILLCLVVLGFLWFLGFSTTDASWGKNWIQVLSPAYHFQQFLSESLSWSSVYYFLVGSFTFLMLLNNQLKRRRSMLL